MPKFDTTAPVSAVLDIPAGHIRFIAADRADTTVEILPANAAKGSDVKAAERITVEYRDGVLRIEAAPERNRLLGDCGAVEVTVQLPTGSRVEAKAAGGEFRGVGRFGDVTFELAQGSVKLDEAESARVTLLDGDVSVRRLRGAARISTQKGDITVAEAMGGEVVLRTESGDVSVVAARGVCAALDAGTGYGRIDNALRNTDGTADLTIHATTAYGDIAARSL
ncbi:DUF4097 family beta strand repeat-containing protein [Streptomyces sp. NPDC047853]|uniref:DUF4097 family beta strand repeat-containing protein n=1 Tax=unclassified Streptomyces TaxID=2593676 RepID=UPI003454470A